MISSSEFECETIPDRDVVTIRLTGALNADTARIVEARLQELWEVGFDHLVLDLAGLISTDEIGLELIQDWYDITRRDGHHLEVIHGNDEQRGTRFRRSDEGPAVGHG